MILTVALIPTQSAVTFAIASAWVDKIVVVLMILFIKTVKADPDFGILIACYTYIIVVYLFVA